MDKAGIGIKILEKRIENYQRKIKKVETEYVKKREQKEHLMSCINSIESRISSIKQGQLDMKEL